jgi:hypothetical protein
MSAGAHGRQFEVHEDSAYQQAEWKTERAGWIVWACILIAALVGLLGPGPYSSIETHSADQQLAIRYDRIARRRADSEIEVRIAPHLARDGQIRLYTSANFLESEAIEGIQPEPHEVVHEGGRIMHIFRCSTAAQPIVIKFRTHPARMGMHDYSWGVDGGPSVAFWRLVLP